MEDHRRSAERDRFDGGIAHLLLDKKTYPAEDRDDRQKGAAPTRQERA
ncbi:MAG: hypothetical protein H6832_17610 [Planctomycetes bacterium]|nr:hypothetical protein [Planctomycetota bacterium]